jgi:hypothetical protein
MRPDLQVARVTLAMLVRSMRWVAPAIVYLVWMLFVIANPGPLRTNALAVYPLHEVVACWLAIIIGNVDDDGHREMCTAVVGSPARLVAVRAATALVSVLVLVVFTTAALIPTAVPRGATIGEALSVLVLLLAAGVFGAGVGSILHRPIVHRIGLVVVCASLALVVGTILPPVIHELRRVNEEQTAGAYVLLGVASGAFVIILLAAMRLANRLSR